MSNEKVKIKNPVIGYTSVIVDLFDKTKDKMSGPRLDARVLATIMERADRSREVEYLEFVDEVINISVDDNNSRWVRVNPYKIGARLKEHVDNETKKIVLEEASKKGHDDWNWY